jgi:hypothetical protein
LVDLSNDLLKDLHAGYGNSGTSRSDALKALVHIVNEHLRGLILEKAHEIVNSAPDNFLGVWLDLNGDIPQQLTGLLDRLTLPRHILSEF